MSKQGKQNNLPGQAGVRCCGKVSALLLLLIELQPSLMSLIPPLLWEVKMSATRVIWWTRCSLRVKNAISRSRTGNTSHFFLVSSNFNRISRRKLSKWKFTTFLQTLGVGCIKKEAGGANSPVRRHKPLQQKRCREMKSFKRRPFSNKR